MSETSINTLNSRYCAIETGIERFLKLLYFCGALCALPMTALVAGGALSRYILGIPITGGPEMTSLLLLLMIMLGEAYCQLGKGNPGIGAIVDMLPSRRQSMLDVFNYSICFIICIALAKGTFDHGLYILGRGAFLSVLRIPLAPFYFIMCFGWAATALASFFVIMREITKVVKK